MLMMGVASAPRDTITTINGETIKTHILGVNESDIRVEDTNYNGRLVSKLPLNYIRSIAFEDGFTARFKDGILDRSELLNSTIVKGEQRYKAEGLFRLTDDEMCTYLGAEDYYYKWRPAQAKLSIGTWQIGVGISLQALGLLWSNQYAFIIPVEGSGVIDDIKSSMHFSGNAFPLALCRMATTTFLYGIGETTASLIRINRFNNGKNIQALTPERAEKQYKMGFGFSMAGMLVTLVGALAWNGSFNPNVEYSLFGGHEYTGYYVENNTLIFETSEKNFVSKKRLPESYIGPWVVVCGTLLTNLGLSIAMPARDVLKNDRKAELSLGPTPGGYGLLVKW